MTYIIIGIILVVLELGYFLMARRYGIVDRPNQRSSHSHITLRGGGIIFLLGTWVWAAFFGFQYGWFLAGLTLVGLVSFADDLHSTPNWLRLVAQFGAMLLMYASLCLYTATEWWIILPALVVCVGIINAYNFMDGINGITGCYSLAVLLPLMWMNRKLNFVDESLLAVTGLSVVIFLFFNFRRNARCFAGDVGSISIAFILLFALGKLILASGDLVYLLFLAVYGADSILTLVHRIMLHEPLGEAHRMHAYQLMSNELGMSHCGVSVLYMCVQLAISVGLIMMPQWQWVYFDGVVVVLAAAYVWFMHRYFHLHKY